MQSIYEADYNHEHLQNIVDNLNLLYVAFTRASHNLIVIAKRANSAYRSAIIESVLDKVASRLEANDVKMELTGIGSDAKTDDISFCYNEIYVPDSSILPSDCLTIVFLVEIRINHLLLGMIDDLPISIHQV